MIVGEGTNEIQRNVIARQLVERGLPLGTEGVLFARCVWSARCGHQPVEERQLAADDGAPPVVEPEPSGAVDLRELL